MIRLIAAAGGVSVFAALALSAPSHAAFDTSRLLGGFDYVVQKNQECATKYWNARSGNANPQGNMRTIINASAYEDGYWLSPRSNTSVEQIEIDAASTASINLRLNYINFLCYPVTAPATNSIATIDSRMGFSGDRSRTYNYGDVAPVGYEGASNSPARTRYGFGLYGITVDGGAANGSIVGGSFTNGAQVISARDNDSRIWMTGTNFTYRPPAGGFTSDKTVNITARVRWINQYYYYGDRFWEISCVVGANKWNTTGTGTNPGSHRNLPDKWYTDQCGEATINLRIRFKVNNRFNLTPRVTGSATTVPEGSQVTVTPSVRNSGPTISTSARWRLVRFIIPANDNSTPKGTGTGTQDPRDYYGFGATNVSGATGTDTFRVDTGTGTIVGEGSQTIPAQPIGTRICWGLSVRPYNQAVSDETWRYSTPYCVTISKKPVMQVRGGDLIVGRGVASPGSAIITSYKDRNGTYYGSWAEYGIIPSGLISGMASGAGYAGGVSNSPLCGVSNLSFVNRTGSGSSPSCQDTQVGRYSLASTTPAVASRFPVNSSTPRLTTTDITSLPASNMVYTAPGGSGSSAAFTISASRRVGQGRPGEWYVIHAPNANVTITSDIRYATSTYTSFSQIPQVVIIARNIIIADNVQNVDAWLIATGTGTQGRINTCGAGGVTESTQPTGSQCTNKLVVNGPVIANRLILRRTYGAGPGGGSGDPAEIFNLRPDAYMWATATQSDASKVQTVQIKELPPRY